MDQMTDEQRTELETLREHKRSFQNIVIFATESYAAVCAELGLSYEAEPESVLKAIRDLRTGIERYAATKTADELHRIADEAVGHYPNTPPYGLDVASLSLRNRAEEIRRGADIR